MKYRIYIDEVGNSDLNSSENISHRFLCLTGVIFNLVYVSEVLQPELEALKVKYFRSHPDEPVILHRKELVNRKYPFHTLADKEIEESFNLEFLNMLSKWDYSVVGVVIDKQELNTNYSESWKYDPYHYCQEVILERFKLFLDLKNAVGDVMIESRGGKEDMRLKKSIRRLMDGGTHYVSSEDLSRFITSKELKVKNKGHNIAGLQLADIVAHSVRRRAFQRIWNIQDGKRTFSDSILEILERDKFFRYKDKIEGYGLKKLP